MIRIEVEEIKAGDLQPGDLFSREPIANWGVVNVASDNKVLTPVGEKVYIRTNAPTPEGDEEVTVVRITIHRTLDNKDLPEEHQTEPEE